MQTFAARTCYAHICIPNHGFYRRRIIRKPCAHVNTRRHVICPLLELLPMCKQVHSLKDGIICFIQKRAWYSD